MAEIKDEKQEKEKDGSSRLFVNATLTDELYKDLLRIQEYYRSPTLTHTIRLMIADKVSAIERLNQGEDGEGGIDGPGVRG